MNTVLTLDHRRNESYPLINVESGKCLDYSRAHSLQVQANCNASTAKRWKFLNDGKQLCDKSSAQCISVPVENDNNALQILFLLPMLGGESGETNCKDCWTVKKKYAQRVYVVKNQIRMFYGTLKKVNNSYISDHLGCLAASNTTGPTSGVSVQFCNDSFKNQTWSFVSFE